MNYLTHKEFLAIRCQEILHMHIDYVHESYNQTNQKNQNSPA